MFSKKPTETVPQPAPPSAKEGWTQAAPPPPAALAPAPSALASGAGRGRPSPSLLAADLVIKGNIQSSGDIQVEGTVEGDIRASTLTVGESATVKGEVVAEEVLVHGRVTGRLRGLKVRLAASARVDGDIVHKTIAIESGAHFEGSVQRQDDPVGQAQPARIAGPREERAPAPLKATEPAE